MDEIMPQNAIQAITRADTDSRITTAKQYPRDLATCMDKMAAMATIDKEAAASMMYSIPRAGEPISGGSIRMAEVAASTYQNIQSGSRVIEIGHDFVLAQGVCYDLENNVQHSCEVRRSIVTKNGHRFSADMINVTANAAAAIALRNAIFKVIPRMYWQGAYNAARDMVCGTLKTLSERRLALIAYLVKQGAAQTDILRAIGRKSIEDVTLSDLEKLHGTATAIKEGSQTMSEAFPKASTDRQPLSDKIAKKKKSKKPVKPTIVHEDVYTALIDLPGEMIAEILKQFNLQEAEEISQCSQPDLDMIMDEIKTRKDEKVDVAN